MNVQDSIPQSKPASVDRESWQAARNELLVREKMFTREGDAIAGARRRLPMTEVPNLSLIGPDGPMPLLDIFQGRNELVVYKHMWHAGMGIEFQCAGCTLSLSGLPDTVYLERRGISFAVFAEGPWEEVAPFVEFMGYQHPWYSAGEIDDSLIGETFGEIVFFLKDGHRIFVTNQVQDRGVEAIVPTFQLLNMSAYGRREYWEDSPEGWPQDNPKMWYWAKDHRPTRQWTRPDAAPVSAGWGDDIHQKH